ncbi:MAG: hypothetical protein BZ151_13020 [Desulfobacca sp. 4484_104]|nr:MAG: hypothetical protein BZ151_13020 [Desulfobacca sp. 4484_104]RLB70070.1 MAG: hypothetical protein DRH04_04215 [Deltaproteobacteria bacterium]
MANLKMDVEVVDSRLVVRPAGLVNVMVRDDFYDLIIQKISSTGINHLVLDLSGVTGLDSSGLGAVFSLYKHVVQDQGSLYFVNPSKTVADLIRITHLDKVIPVKQNLDELPEVEA